MRRTPYHQLAQLDDEDYDENLSDEKFSLLNENKNEPTLKKPASSPDVVGGLFGIELRSRNARGDKNSPSRYSDNGADNQTVFIERKIKKDDSLRNLALQYGISVADLKRVNGLMSDQEFYGKDVLKIPVKKYGHHHDLFNDDDGVGFVDVSNDNERQKISDETNEFVDLNLIDYSTTQPSTSSAAVAAENIVDRENMPGEMFLKTVDENLQKIKSAQIELERASRNSPASPLDADDDEIPFGDSSILIAPGTASTSPTIRSLWLHKNVSHFVVVVLIVFLLILVPAFYLLYKLVTAVENAEGNT